MQVPYTISKGPQSVIALASDGCRQSRRRLRKPQNSIGRSNPGKARKR